ncbi:MAG: trimethylamine corrinoid protein 2 [Bacillota bacterium]|nr:trimethylamine corrinoid protein 2 [Bacillota bacterium]
MEFCPDWEQVRERYLAWWARENHERPLVLLSAPRERPYREAGAVSAARRRAEFSAADWRDWWWDIERVIRDTEHDLKNRRFYGEALPLLNPNLGPDYFAACYGTELTFGADTSWAEPWLTAEDIAGGWQPRLDPGNPYRQRMRELTAAGAAAGEGRWLTGVTDLHPGLDALVSLRGAEGACLDLVDEGGRVEELVLEFFAGMKEIYGELAAITDRYQEGTVNWMQIWHPGHWYVTSCDALALISVRDAGRFVKPELEAELNWLDASIFHLDGPDALRHLDWLLEERRLAGIQWVYGAGQPGARHWLELLQRIQAAGKNIQVEVRYEDLEPLLTALRPEGLMLCCQAASELEAERIMERVEELARRGASRG